MRFQTEAIQNVLKEKNYVYSDTINIIGIRSKSKQSNSFDDWLYLIYKDDKNKIQTRDYPITTDPGTYWLKNPQNVHGTAILVPNQYKNSHTFGLHRNSYEALKQKNPLKVWRDNNKDDILDHDGEEHEGIFGINIHRSNPTSESTVVEKWSAGCQVFKRVKDFNEFMEICKKSGQTEFTYTLLVEEDFN